MKYHEKTFYEDKRCLIVRDGRQFIIRTKPIDPEHPYRDATYITNGQKYLIWELCKCRKLYSESSSEVKAILELLKAQGMASERSSATFKKTLGLCKNLT